MSVLYIRNDVTGEFEPVKTIRGSQGPPGSIKNVELYNENPSELGIPSPGISMLLSRGDHRHKMPTPEEMGALGKNEAAADTKKLGTKTPSYYGRLENIVDNGDFTRFIAQAGLNGMHYAEAYAGDRWVLGDNAKVTGKADGSTFKNIVLNGKIKQRFVNPPDVATPFIEMISGTATAEYMNGELIVQSDGGMIKNVSLYPGIIEGDPPPYIPKGIGAELMECMRYCVILPAYTHLRTDTVSTNQVWFTIPFGVSPRILTNPLFEADGLIIRHVNNKPIETDENGDETNGFVFTIGLITPTNMRLVATRSGHGLNDCILRSNKRIVFSFDVA